MCACLLKGKPGGFVREMILGEIPSPTHLVTVYIVSLALDWAVIGELHCCTLDSDSV